MHQSSSENQKCHQTMANVLGVAKLSTVDNHSLRSSLTRLVRLYVHRGWLWECTMEELPPHFHDGHVQNYGLLNYQASSDSSSFHVGLLVLFLWERTLNNPWKLWTWIWDSNHALYPNSTNMVYQKRNVFTEVLFVGCLHECMTSKFRKLHGKMWVLRKLNKRAQHLQICIKPHSLFKY